MIEDFPLAICKRMLMRLAVSSVVLGSFILRKETKQITHHFQSNVSSIDYLYRLVTFSIYDAYSQLFPKPNMDFTALLSHMTFYEIRGFDHSELNP